MGGPAVDIRAVLAAVDSKQIRTSFAGAISLACGCYRTSTSNATVAAHVWYDHLSCPPHLSIDPWMNAAQPACDSLFNTCAPGSHVDQGCLQSSLGVTARCWKSPRCSALAARVKRHQRLNLPVLCHLQ